MLLLYGCDIQPCYQVHGPIRQWDYYIADFNKIRVYNAPELYIIQGDTQSVVVEAEDNMFQALLFHIDPFEKRLFIDFDEVCVDDIDHFKIFITVDTLKELDLKGGGEVWVQGTMTTERLDILISGTVDVNINYLKASLLRTDISGAGTVRVSNGDTLSKHSFNASGLGSFFGFGMPTRKMEVTVSGGSAIQSTVSDTLDVSISGTADVYYKGYPVILQDITGTGQVIDAN
jgi:hypothetical protein